MSTSSDPNIYDVGTESRGIPGFASMRQRVGDASGSRRIGTSVWDLPAGEGAYPYHYHYVEEEQLIVLEGTPLLRDVRGWRRLERGAVVTFLPGAEGGHQLYNDGPGHVRFLAISTSGEPDIVAYPDQGKIGVFERPPGDGALWHLFRISDEVDYDNGDIQPPIVPSDIP